MRLLAVRIAEKPVTTHLIGMCNLGRFPFSTYCGLLGNTGRRVTRTSHVN
jgi:hypothetical protein